MENITTFLAQIWGPVTFAVGLGIFASRRYYARVYRNLAQETLAVVILGMAAIAAGIAQIVAHNTWGTFAECVISILGWGTLAKGALLAIAPGLVERAGTRVEESGLLPVAGALMLALGAYLIWIGYLA